MKTLAGSKPLRLSYLVFALLCLSCLCYVFRDNMGNAATVLATAMLFSLAGALALIINKVGHLRDPNWFSVEVLFYPGLAILDWQMTPRYGGEATYGCKYFDLAWFVSYLLWTPTLDYVYRDPVIPAARIVLDAYFSESPSECGDSSFRQYAERFFSVDLPFRQQLAKWRARLLQLRIRSMTRKFLRLLDAMPYLDRRPQASHTNSLE